MKAWFISDIHLKSLNERNGNILLRFLHSLNQSAEKPTHLFLLGDIFELWVGDHDFYRKKFSPIIDEIDQLKKSGTEIYYFEGNHDIHLRRFWKRYGVECFMTEKYFQLGPWKLRLEHGDHINPNEVLYHKTLDFLRRPQIEKVANAIPARFMNAMGMMLSGLSQRNREYKPPSNKDHLKEMIRHYAEKAYLKEKFDLIITGHMHVQDDFQFSVHGKPVRSINLGSWFDEPQALLLDEQGPSWVALK